MYKLWLGRGPSEHVLALHFHRNHISKIPSKSINQKVFLYVYIYTMHSSHVRENVADQSPSITA